MRRYSDFRLDASSLKEYPDGSIRVTAQLTHPGVFDYRNGDGSPRREYRPAEEVFRKDALESFAGATATLNHPRQADGSRKVSAATWKKDAVGHVGDSVRQDGDHAVADIYVRDAATVASVKRGDVKYVSCGYDVDYVPTPGVAPDGSRYDGIQRNIRGNHVALLPNGIAPRGGTTCVLRLDSAGDEVEEEPARADSAPALDCAVTPEQIAALQAQVAVLTTELASARADAVQLAPVRAELATAKTALAAAQAAVAPERLDALVEERQAVCAVAKANGIDPVGKSALALKRAIVAKRTPALAARIDSFDGLALDGMLAVYGEQPHPSLNILGGGVSPPPEGGPVRTDAAGKPPTITTLYDKSVTDSRNAWKNAKGDLK